MSVQCLSSYLLTSTLNIVCFSCQLDEPCSFYGNQPLTECSNVLTDVYRVFLLLLHCCILLEIKLRTIATATDIAAAGIAGGAGAGAGVAAATATATDVGTCTFTQPLVLFHLKLHLYPVC